MRLLPTALCALLVGSVCAAPTRAQVRALPYAGYALNAGLDVERVFSAPRPLDATGGVLVGIGLEVPLLTGRFPFTLKVVPTAEIVFVPGATDEFEGFGAVEVSQRLVQLGGTFVAEFTVPGTPLSPHVGLGLAYARYAVSFEERGDVDVVGDTEVRGWALGPALVGGVRFGAGRIVPLVQVRYSFTDPSPSFDTVRAGSEIGDGVAAVLGVSIGL